MSPMRHIRLRLSLPLTGQEIKRLEARAAGEVRSVANYVAWVIQQGPGDEGQAQAGRVGR